VKASAQSVTIETTLADAGGETPKGEVECWNNFPHPQPKELTPPLTKVEKAASNTPWSS